MVDSIRAFTGASCIGSTGPGGWTVLLLQNKEVKLKVIVGKGSFAETVWGCDLTKEYIDINAFYTT